MNRNRLLLVLVLVLAVGLSGCANIFPFFKKQPTEIVVTPAEVKIAVDEERELTAVVKDNKGKEMNVKAADIKWVIEDVEEAEGAEEGGEDPGPVAELSAATGAKVKVKGLRVGEAKITVSYDDITAEVPVTVTEAEEEEPEEPEEPETLILLEDFSGLQSIDDFWKASYKALPGTTDQPMYRKTGGGVALEDGHLVIGSGLKGGRFTIGMPDGHHSTKDTSKQPEGVFDLTKDYTITIEYTETRGNNDKKFQVYVDNNETRQDYSVHGSKSKVYESKLSDLPALQDGVGTIVINMIGDDRVGTATSFLQVRVESEAELVIKSIKIEYVE